VAAVTAPVRTDADWTVEGRHQLGHEVLDLAPAAGDELGRDGFCYTGWYAWQLGLLLPARGRSARGAGAVGRACAARPQAATMTPYYADEWVTVHHGNSLELVPALGLTADLLLCDPPYGVTDLPWDRWPAGWPSALASAARSMWVFGTVRMFLDHHPDFAKWKLSQEIVWRKSNSSGASPLQTDRFRRAHELALHWYQGRWASVYHEPVVLSGEVLSRGVTREAPRENGWHGDRGSRQWVDNGSRLATSIIDSPNMHGRNPRHPTEKPVRVLDPLIRYACPPGGVVLDPMAGSGSTGEAARLSGRRAVLIETDERYAEVIARRMSQDILPIDTAREEAP